MKKISILYVEDNLGDVRIIRELLDNSSMNSFELHVASNFKIAAKTLNEFSFDVILLDLNLPEFTGIDTFKMMKNLATDIPIILLTGIQDDILSEQTVQLGAQDYLIKSNMTTDLLTNAIKYAIDRHNFTKKLSETQLQYHMLIEKNSDGILVIDKDGMVKYINPAGELLFGRSKEELIGFHFGFPTSLDSFIEISIVGKDGNIKFVEMRMSEIIWEDKNSYLAALRDITERKNIENRNIEISEQLKLADIEKDKFFSIIAHDLKSPFNVFLGMTELLNNELGQLTQKDIKKLANALNKSANKMYELLENLLDWSRIKRGKMPFEPKLNFLDVVLGTAMEMLREVADNKKIKMILIVEPDLTFFGDMQMVSAVVRNLLANAIKFTHPGGTIKLLALAINDKLVEIIVRDNGIGMSQEMISNLFRLDVNSSRIGTDGEPGTGLGLILCKEFTEKHSGNIWVESEEGKGSAFHFTLPLKMDAALKSK